MARKGSIAGEGGILDKPLASVKKMGAMGDEYWKLPEVSLQVPAEEQAATYIRSPGGDLFSSLEVGTVVGVAVAVAYSTADDHKVRIQTVYPGITAGSVATVVARFPDLDIRGNQTLLKQEFFSFFFQIAAPQVLDSPLDKEGHHQAEVIFMKILRSGNQGMNQSERPFLKLVK
jgi:hypothetical protein